MKNKSNFLNGYLTTAIFAAIYVGMVLIHIFLESFVLESQILLFTTMLPFILCGIILDFILSRNTTLSKGNKKAAQIIPAGVFILQAISFINLWAGRKDNALMGYLIWLFLAVPFFIASYQKESHKNKMIFSLIGSGILVIVYLYLTTITNELDEGAGAVIIFISYFCMLYAASGIRKLPFLGTLLGVFNALGLLYLRYFPVTADAKKGSWDYDIAFNLELMILITFGISILIRLLAAFQKPTPQLEVK